MFKALNYTGSFRPAPEVGRTSQAETFGGDE